MPFEKEVFVKEQGMPPQDEFDQFNALDGIREYILVFYKDQAVGTGRVRFLENTGKLKRICIFEPYWNFSLGKVVI